MTDGTDAIRAKLAKVGRAYARAQKVIREDMPAAVREAREAGLTNADIAREVGHVITPERVRQIAEKPPAE